MKQIHPKHFRIMAITPTTKGFGFAVLEKPESLIDWGVKSVEGDKNAGAVKRTDELIASYQPGLLVLQDTSSEDSRRAPRIRALTRRLVTLASRRKIEVALLSRKQMKQVFFANGEGTKYEVAEILAQRFPEQLSSRLPPKRKPWKSEDSRMGIFDAVALALSHRLRDNS